MKAYMVVEYRKMDSSSHVYGKVYLREESARKAIERHRRLEDSECYFWVVREVQICGNPKALVVFHE